MRHTIGSALAIALAFLVGEQAFAQTAPSSFSANDKFEQLGTALPTPNTFRTAAGSPGKDYFQNRADYDIKVTLDDVEQKIIGSETVTYFNNSTDELRYIWLQLDQNLFAKGSTSTITRTGGVPEAGMTFATTRSNQRSWTQCQDPSEYRKSPGHR